MKLGGLLGLLWLAATFGAAACGSVVQDQPDDGGTLDAPDEAGGDGPDGRDGDGGNDGDTGAEDADELPTDVVTVCGNGVVEPPEECDDSNSTPDDGCENDCTWSCESADDCDDGEVCNGEEICSLEEHYCVSSTFPPDGTPCELPDGEDGACRGGVCADVLCGNGHVDGDEECDDGNIVDTDECRNNCVAAFCGDGVVWESEEECDGNDPECVTRCGTAGVHVCVDCEFDATRCTPPAEVCNGVDDDCVNGCDDGFACCLRASRDGIEAESGCPYTETCVGSCVWGPPDFGRPPDNDTCAGAIDLAVAPGLAGSYTGSTCAALDDYAPSCLGGSGDRGPDVVYRLVLPEPRFVMLSTEGTRFDTALSLYNAPVGGTCPGTEVECNDDSAAGAEVQYSEISRTLSAGTYYVVLDGKDGARGEFRLDVAVFDPPTNDECSTARLLTPNSTVRSAVGVTLGATDDGVRCGGGTAGPDVWYRIPIGVGQRLVYLDLLDGQTWPGRLRIYSECPVEPTSPPLYCETAGACTSPRPKWFGVLGTNDATSRTVYVAVDGAAAADAGPFRLSYQVTDPACAVATQVRVAGMQSGTVGVTTGFGSSGTCAPVSGPEALYVVAPCPGSTLSASTCYGATAVNTNLYIRNEGCGLVPGPGVERACATLPGTACGGFPNGTQTSFTFDPTHYPGLCFLFVDSDAVSVSDGAYQVHINGTF